MSSSRDFRDLDGADPWKLLGVGRNAGADEIRRSYRRLSRSHHTDVGGEAAQQAKLNRAYAILSDPDRRAGYALLLSPKPRPQDRPSDRTTPTEPTADPFEWSSGPGHTRTPPRQDPYSAPPYQDPYTAPPYQDPHTAPPYRDPHVAPPYDDSFIAAPYRDPYSAPAHRPQRRGVNGQAVAALLTSLLCAPLSIYLAAVALRKMRWSGQRGKTVAWLALLLAVGVPLGTLINRLLSGN